MLARANTFGYPAHNLFVDMQVTLLNIHRQQCRSFLENCCV